ncbi:MAG TPA: type II secretion system protein [Verrucomicrobiae bacterium]
MNPAPFKRRAQRGFTLVEIMIVIAIMALVVGVGVPSMVRNMQRDDLARAVNDVIEGAKTARDRAILQGVPWVLVIRENQVSLEAAPGEQKPTTLAGIPEETDDGAPPKKLPTAPTLQSGFPRTFGEDVAIQLLDVNFINHMEGDFDQARVRFFPNGTSDEFTIVLAWKDKQRTVTLDIITGLATELRL